MTQQSSMYSPYAMQAPGMSAPVATGANGKPIKSKKQQHTLSSLSAAAAAQQAAQAAAQAQQHHQHHQQAQRQSPVAHSQFTPPMHAEEDMMYTHSYDDPRHRQSHHAHPQSHHAHANHRRSHSPLFTTSSAFSSYPPPEDSSSIPSTNASVSSSTSSSTTGVPSRAEYRDYRGYEYNDWTMAAAVPVTLPSMNHFTDGLALKRESMDSMHSMDSMDSMSMDGIDESLSGGDPVAAAAAAAAVTATMAPYMSTYNFLTTGIDSVNPYDSNPHVSLRRS